MIKPGGYLTNDKLPPGLYLDNIPSWEKGVMTQLKDLSRVIRNDYSRNHARTKMLSLRPRSFSRRVIPGYSRQPKNALDKALRG